MEEAAQSFTLRRKALWAFLVVSLLTIALYVRDHSRGFSSSRTLDGRDVKIATTKLGHVGGQNGFQQLKIPIAATHLQRSMAREHKEHYLLCDEQSQEPLNIVFGMLAAPKYVRTRITASLKSYLRTETSVVYLENEEDESLRARVAKYLTNNEQLRGVDFTVVYLKRTAIDIEVQAKPGGWKNLQILRDLWERFHLKGKNGKQVDWFVTVDDDTFIVTHNMYIHLSTYYTSMARRSKCRGWEEYDAARKKPDSIHNTQPQTNLIRGTKFLAGDRQYQGWQESDALYVGKHFYFNNQDEAKAGENFTDPVYFGVNMTFIHGGGGIFMNRAAMAKMAGNGGYEKCEFYCRQPIAGDLRVGCCARYHQVEPTVDSSFNFISVLAALSPAGNLQKYTQPTTHGVSFHGNRQNYTIVEELTRVLDNSRNIDASCELNTSALSAKEKSVAAGMSSKNRYNGGMRCNLKAVRGRDSPTPIFWDVINIGFNSEPLLSKYPTAKRRTWGKDWGLGEGIELNDHVLAKREAELMGFFEPKTNQSGVAK